MKRNPDARFPLAYILNSINNNCKGAVDQIKFPAEVLTKLETMLQAVPEPAIDKKLLTLQYISLRKGGTIIEYTNRMLELVS